ncbi:MAG: 16S rRNA (cytosine(967)-C(5))-methyltransferase RsmB [Clostridia bacterium]|nr:16S rRNA (cytosine(967)-C(5))-methyltransferase RsmB [Clostridia bacterium]
MNTAFLQSYECLKSVYVDKAFSGIELNKRLLFAKKSDKALITKIVYGVLDCDIELDYVLSKFTKKVNKDAVIYLKIGVYCLKYLSIPVYAVVNDVVELAKTSGDRRLVGFVNATLKNIAQNLDTLAYPEDEIDYHSVKYSYPKWALLKLIKDYGRQTAFEIVSTTLPTATTIRVNTDKISVDQFKELLDKNQVDYKPTILPNAFAIQGKLDLDDDLYTVQSLSSMLVCHALAPKGATLDACSAPGGKAVYLKQLGATNVTACELHPHRADLVKAYAKRMGVQLDVVCADSTQTNPQWLNCFDYLLCDVPCSGFGVLDNRPDIKLFRQNQDISGLMKLQYAILQNCSQYLKVGGSLVYSTCTVFVNENKQIVDKFIKQNPNFTYDEIQLPITSNANGKGCYQFLPHQDGVQGFFCAKLKRID